MVDLNENTNQSNAELLLEGLWYKELPDILIIENLQGKLPEIIDYINNKSTSHYTISDDELIIDFKNIASPPYIYKPGVEAITYYTFKKNKSWREMQIPNLVYYVAFIYNTISVFDELFAQLYLTPENNEIVKNSNSYLLFGETFSLRVGYDDDSYEDAEIGKFTTKNNKANYSVVYSENKKRYLKAEGSYIYSVKLDIESFFPNIYTHFFSKIKDFEPYNLLGARDKYFDFLDKYSMRINNNQTKGIPAGVFSSHISAELCMLCVDCEIRKVLDEKKISYIRYVDDLTFFSDSEKNLDEIKPVVQKILNDYRLRINGNKTVMTRSTHACMPTDISEAVRILPYLDSSNYDVKSINLDEFYSLKLYILECLSNNRTAQIKSVLTNLLKVIKSSCLFIDECSYELFCYLLKLVWDDESLTYHVYKLLDIIIESSDDKETLLQELYCKLDIIDKEYPDTLLQIWHYYVYLKYLTNQDKLTLIKKLKEKKYNPIIISLFVIQGNKNNKELLNYIKEEYINETSSDQWKAEIMFSKWWLPIFKILLADNYNYYSFMNSSVFPDILRKFRS